mmetsp:Transcript_15061/g.51633  ORF Transcript_15061/g.51633 Transcript_15061/m.51633 type:complete len:215 (-) Transcript_15061:119-763(-)
MRRVRGRQGLGAGARDRHRRGGPHSEERPAVPGPPPGAVRRPGLRQRGPAAPAAAHLEQRAQGGAPDPGEAEEGGGGGELSPRGGAPKRRVAGQGPADQHPAGREAQRGGCSENGAAAVSVWAEQVHVSGEVVEGLVRLEESLPVVRWRRGEGGEPDPVAAGAGRDAGRRAEQRGPRPDRGAGQPAGRPGQPGEPERRPAPSCRGSARPDARHW